MPLSCYILILAAWCFQLTLYACHNRNEPNRKHRLSVWQICQQVIPFMCDHSVRRLEANSTSRRMLIMSTGVTVLLARTFYENLLLSGMLVPKSPAKPLTLAQITAMVADDDWHMMFSHPNNIEEQMRKSDRQLDAALQNSHQVVYKSEPVAVLDWLAVYPQTFAFAYTNDIRKFLPFIPAESCRQFAVVQLTDFASGWMAVPTSPQLSKHTFERLNSEVTHRLEWMLYHQRQPVKNVSVECWEHYFPSQQQLSRLDVDYASLSVQAVSGWVVVYGILVAIATLAFIGEKLWAEANTKQKEISVELPTVDLTALRRIPAVHSNETRDLVMDVLGELIKQMSRVDFDSEHVVVIQ